MRTTFLLLSSAVLLAACADGETTAPRSRRSGPTSAAANQSEADFAPGPGATARPTDQVGWTKAATNYSDAVTIPAGASQTALANCPAGTTPTGGGFYFSSMPPLLPPAVVDNTPFGSGTAWNVVVRNYAGSGGAATVRAYVRCAS
jgi:hypothetical protein